MGKTFGVFGSQGSFEADVETGCVVRYDTEDADYLSIAKFDVNEWKSAYPDEDLEGMNLDILDIGSWDKAGNYGGPELDWRAEFVDAVVKNRGILSISKKE